MLNKSVLPITLVLFFCIFVAGPAAMAQGSTYYFPQIVDGSGGNEFLFTQILVNNVQDIAATFTLTFHQSNGSPWVIDLRSFDTSWSGGAFSTKTFNINPKETINFFSGGVDPLNVGWLEVKSSLPLVISASFGVADATANPPELLTESGVLSSPIANEFSFGVNVSTTDNLNGTSVDTGVALINPSDHTANITAQLIPRAGGAAINSKPITLLPGEHKSQYFSELFNDTAFATRFHGTVRLSSNVAFGVLVMKFSYSSTFAMYSTIPADPDSKLKPQIVYDREDNSTMADAELIAAPAEIFGTINSYIDTAEYDYYSINLAAGQVLYAIDISELAGSPLNGYLSIRDSTDSQLVGISDFSAGLKDPFIRYAVTSTGTYYIRIEQQGGTSSRQASYRIFVLVK